jgi:hypothetical protein
MRRVALIATVLLAAVPATARADGLPAVGIDAHPLALPEGDVAYITRAGAHSTRLIEHARYGGPLRERRLRGSFSIPAVAYDGSPSGLSADGRKLILISPRKRFPRRRTTLAVVDTRTLTVRSKIALSGDFSFDAISPDGRTMYLIQYSSRDVLNYAVRAYDLRSRRLLRGPIVDPDEPDEAMKGIPVTRIAGMDGRWAYTLYDNGRHSFVHALDTSRRTAVCIDLDVRRAWGSTLALRGHRLDVISRHARVLASIDTRTHAVTATAAPSPARRRTEDASTSWLPLAAPTALLLLVAVGARRRMLKKTAAKPMTETWEPPSDRHAPTA